MALDLVSLINNSCEQKEDGKPKVNFPSPIPKYSNSYPDCFFKFISKQRKFPPMKHDTLIRVSSIGNLCPRKETIRAKYNIDDFFNIDGSIGFAMMLGELIHNRYRFIMGMNGGYVGSWKCVKCGATTDDKLVAFKHTELPSDRGDDSGRDLVLTMMPSRCSFCGFDGNVVLDKEVSSKKAELKAYKNSDGYPFIIFNEWGFYNKEFGITGHWDGARIDIDDKGEPIVQELKSSSGSFFKKVGKIGGCDPHITQLLTEMWLTGLKNGELVYLNKSGWGEPRSFIKRFPFDFNMSYVERNVFEPVTELRKHLRNGTISDYGICSNSDDEKCKSCIVRDFCFDIKKKERRLDV